MPAALREHLTEPSFLMEDVTFGGFHDGSAWTLRGNAAPLADDLAILSGDPTQYRRYVAEYFEVDVPLAAITHVLDGKKLDAKIIASIGGTRTLAELKPDLTEIGYGSYGSD